MALHSAEQNVANKQLLNALVADPARREISRINPRRLLGAYYTPDALANILATWALAPENGNVLDPSFGGCAFLNAATTILASRGVSKPGERVFGVDVDPTCMEYVHKDQNLVEKNCIIRDFLSLSPKNIPGAPFHTIIGNPPYVRHHWFNGTIRKAGRTAMAAAGVTLPETASAWAYFLIHTLSFIAKNGRLAMLVPEAILQADYATVVRDLLTSRFDHVCLVHIRDRLFEGTDEAVVAVAASQYGGKKGTLRVEAVEHSEDLAAVLNIPKGGRSTSHLTTQKGRRIDSQTVQLLGELEQHSATKKISDVATVRVGLVTGANKYFIRNAKNLKQIGIPQESWVQLVSRTRWLSGLDFTKEDLQELVEADQQAILVRPTPASKKAPGIKQWIDEGIKADVHKRYKCTIRDPWFRVDPKTIPDAFATCTRMGAPLLVLNEAGCRCTNALHAMYWHCRSDALPPAIAVGFLTSAVSVWAELHGRRYGGGVLKMEPGTLNRTPVPIVQSAEDAFDELNKLIRNGREAEARKRADDLVLGDQLGLPKKDIQRLQQAHAQLMTQRRPTRNGTNHG
ncbi:MAG: N-6 DNA methylase [Candidatus Latescibacteria bacterium]|nr:N-6 DNA methylase [Candidatus Latescibacterota bacterium]